MTEPGTLHKGANLGTFAETSEDLNDQPNGEETESKMSSSHQEAFMPVDLTNSKHTPDQQAPSPSPRVPGHLCPQSQLAWLH